MYFSLVVLVLVTSNSTVSCSFWLMCLWFLFVLLQVELTGSSVFDYVHPGDHVEMAEQLGMKLPPGRGLLSQGGGAEDGASSASSSSHSETPEPGKIMRLWVALLDRLEHVGLDEGLEV